MGGPCDGTKSTVHYLLSSHLSWTDSFSDVFKFNNIYFIKETLYDDRLIFNVVSQNTMYNFQNHLLLVQLKN